MGLGCESWARLDQSVKVVLDAARLLLSNRAGPDISFLQGSGAHSGPEVLLQIDEKPFRADWSIVLERKTSVSLPSLKFTNPKTDQLFSGAYNRKEVGVSRQPSR